MASAIVMFVILVGVVTFKTWPEAGGLLGGGGRDVALQGVARPAPERGAESSGLNLVKLLGGDSGSAARGQGGGAGTVNGLVPGGSVGAPGGSTSLPGGSGGSHPEDAQPPAAATEPRNVLSEAVSDVGNTVQTDTESLGNTVNQATGTNLGSVVTSLGDTLNKNLQSLAGNG